MCGLFGAIKLKRKANISPRKIARLAKNMDARGGDSVGWIADHGNGLGITEKHLGNASSVAKRIREDATGASLILGHTRFATHGDVQEMINNHPHEYLGIHAWGAVAHNGVIANHEMTAKENHCNLLGECDSEILARLMELDAHLPVRTRAIDAVDSCDNFSKITTTIAESNLETGTTTLAIIARGNPLYYSVYNGVLYWASTYENLPAPTLLAQNALLIVEDGRMEVVHSAVSSIRQAPTFLAGWRTDWRDYGKRAKKKPTTTIPWWKLV